MPSSTIWNNHYVGAGRQTCSWSVPSGCTADSLYVKREGGTTSVYLYWRDGQWKLSGTQSSTYAVSGTSGSETFFSGGTSGGSSYATVIVNYHTVEAASTISASNITFPNNINNRTVMSTVNISNSTMNISNLRHTVTWTCGSFTGSVTTNLGDTSASFNIYDACAQFPAGSSATMTISCVTRNSSNQQIGSATSANIILTLPQINPLLTVNATVNNSTQWHTRNISEITSVHISGTCTPAFNGNVSSIRVTGGGVDVYKTLSDFTTGFDVLISQSGSIALTVTATCSRGWSTQVSSDAFTFLQYTTPSIIASCYRCNRAGVTKPDGTFIACQVQFEYTLFDDSITPNNAPTVTFYYSSDSGSTWEAFTPSRTTSVNNSTTILRITPEAAGETDETADGGFRTDHIYRIRAAINDTVGQDNGLIGSATSAAVGTAEVFMRWDHGHNAFGFGAYPSENNSVYLNPTWKLFTHGNEIIDLLHPVGSVYMSINNVDPSTIFPGTVWSPINQDQYLMSAGATVAGGTTGGSATHTHTTSGHTLTAAELPQHYHGYLDWWNTSLQSGQTDTRAAVAVNGDTQGGANMNNRSRTNGVIMSTTDMSVRTGNNINQPHDHGDTGAASNKPPYYAVYMWVRTA